MPPPKKPDSRSVPPAVHRRVHQLLAEGLSHKAIVAAMADEKVSVSKVTVCRLSKFLPPPELKKSPKLELPESIHKKFPAERVDSNGWWLVLGDVHIPHHDRKTVELAVAEAKRRKCKGVLLNGDILDSHEVSRHDRDPSALRYVDEVERGKQFLGWLRKQLPSARIIYKHGNHDERLDAYIIGRAPALFGLEGVNLESILHFEDYSIESVRDRRVVQLGHLNVIHGHEYPGGASSSVNPARGLYLKARSVAMCGHHHRTSEHHARDIKGKSEAAWSVGCACDLSPRWMPLTDWNHGFAFVHLDKGGEFGVENKRVLNGRLL